MLKQLLHEAARRLVADTARVGRNLVPPADVAQLAAHAARAATRNWAAATALAEVSAARFARSTPETAPADGPLRILVAAPFGAMGPLETLQVKSLVTALEAAADQPRERAIRLTLCATRAAASAADELAHWLFRQDVVDATAPAASDIAAWVAGHDLVLAPVDPADATLPAAVELGVMALGFARARGLPALAPQVFSPPSALAPDARAFLRRFASRARFACIDADIASAWKDAGFVVVPPPAIGTMKPLQSHASSNAPIVAVARARAASEAPPSPLGELARLGRLLLQGSGPTPKPFHDTPREPLGQRARGLDATRVTLGLGISPWPDAASAALVLATDTELDTWTRNLSPDTCIVCDDPALIAHFARFGFTTSDLGPDHTVIPRATPAFAPAVPLAAWLEPLLPRLAAQPLALPSPDSDKGAPA